MSSDEIWLHHLGAVTIEFGGDDTQPVPGDREVVGIDIEAGQAPQVIVPAGMWQRTIPGDEDALVSCVVSPGFDLFRAPPTDVGAGHLVSTATPTPSRASVLPSTA